MAAKKKNFKSLIEANMKKGIGRFQKQTIPEDVYESREWFRNKAIRTRSLKGASSKRIMRIGLENQRMRPYLN